MLVPPPGATPKPHLPKLNPLRCMCPTCWQRRCPRTKTPGLVTPDHPRSTCPKPSGTGPQSSSAAPGGGSETTALNSEMAKGSKRCASISRQI